MLNHWEKAITTADYGISVFVQNDSWIQFTINILESELTIDQMNTLIATIDSSANEVDIEVNFIRQRRPSRICITPKRTVDQ